ncbi:MAG: hypothetical protein AMJ66_10770 [Betaproteobacteria bacterium SG8_40]|nr:MAG: hypothetical protein AMJ66_10770 [Betaproteobacteria bacterium SG8_40]
MSATPIQQWLDEYCQESSGVAAGVVVLAESAGVEPALAAATNADVAQAEGLRSVAGETFKTQAPVLRQGDGLKSGSESGSRVISVPLKMGEQPVGAIALELNAAQKNSSESMVLELSRATDAFAKSLSEAVVQRAVADAARLLEFQEPLLTHQTLREGATALATELASVLKLDHVSIGFRDRTYSRVEAVSSFADFEQGARVFKLISIAMDEAIDQSATVAHPSVQEDRPRINVAHAELGKHRSCAVCSVPVVDDGQTIGAITFERGGESAFSRHEVADFEQIVSVVGPVLHLKRETERSWHWRLGRAIADMAARFVGPGHVVSKCVAAGALLVVCASVLVTTDYRIGAPARLEGSVQRALVAPSEGYLESAYVRPGDKVEAGQVLVELARQDLELERRKWESELSRHENAAPAALARGDRSEFVISQAFAEEARAKLGLVEEQISRASIVAPFDGVVIMGDLSQTLGAPVRRGDTLVTVAPANEFRLILEIDERDIGDIAVGQAGHLALGAMPDRNFEFQVHRISPVAQARDGRNYFEIECTLEESLDAMRPGLQGVARIVVDQRSFAWVVTHRLIDWMRIAAWSLGV